MNASIIHSGLYSTIAWIATIGSSSGPHVFPFAYSPVASLTDLMRNILLALLHSVFHLVVLSGFLN